MAIKTLLAEFALSTREVVVAGGQPGPASYQRRLNDLFTLRAAGFGPGFAPKNPRLGDLQVIRVCTN
jgi:hypothetical protein